MRISHFGTALFFAVFGIIELLLGIWDKFDGMLSVKVFIVFCAVINFVFAFVYGKYYFFDTDGIQHRLLGICYRRTMWNEIKDIMLVYQQTGERGRPKTLMFTTKDAPIYRPDASGYIKDKGFYSDWICGKLFSIRLDEKKEGGKILGYIEKYYGQLNYNFFDSSKH